MIDSVTADVPSGYVEDLDHGSRDLHRFVAERLIYHSEIDPDFDAMMCFYQRPGWQETLRTFAIIDQDQSAVLTEALNVIAAIKKSKLEHQNYDKTYQRNINCCINDHDYRHRRRRASAVTAPDARRLA